MADCYEIIGQPSKAHELFQYLVRLDPDNALSHFNLGNFFLRQNQHIEAVKCYEEALKRDSDFTDALYNIGWVLHQAGAYIEALRYTEKGLKSDPVNEDLIKQKKELLFKIS